MTQQENTVYKELIRQLEQLSIDDLKKLQEDIQAILIEKEKEIENSATVLSKIRLTMEKINDIAGDLGTGMVCFVHKKTKEAA